MAIAPLNKVDEVLSYALAEIPREKIVMGMPNYAYDWALPYVRGYTEAANISNVEAARIAAQTGAVIQFDRTSKSPHFDYWQESVQHKVWFGDVRSVEAKVQLALKRRILGKLASAKCPAGFALTGLLSCGQVTLREIKGRRTDG